MWCIQTRGKFPFVAQWSNYRLGTGVLSPWQKEALVGGVFFRPLIMYYAQFRTSGTLVSSQWTWGWSPQFRHQQHFRMIINIFAKVEDHCTTTEWLSNNLAASTFTKHYYVYLGYYCFSASCPSFPSYYPSTTSADSSHDKVSKFKQFGEIGFSLWVQSKKQQLKYMHGFHIPFAYTEIKCAYRIKTQALLQNCFQNEC